RTPDLGRTQTCDKQDGSVGSHQRGQVAPQVTGNLGVDQKVRNLATAAAAARPHALAWTPGAHLKRPRDPCGVKDGGAGWRKRGVAPFLQIERRAFASPWQTIDPRALHPDR